MILPVWSLLPLRWCPLRPAPRHRHPWHLPPQRQLVAPFAEGQGVHLGVARPWSGGPGQLWPECPSTSNISIQASFIKDMSEAVQLLPQTRQYVILVVEQHPDRSGNTSLPLFNSSNCLGVKAIKSLSDSMFERAVTILIMTFTKASQ